MVGVAMGINNLLEIFNEKYYENLEGGILESFGRLFKNAIKLYIYPMRKSAYDRYCMSDPANCPVPSLGSTSHPLAVDVWINATNLQVELHLRNLYAHLLENHYLAPIVGFEPKFMDIFSRDVLKKIYDGEGAWDKMVPERVAALIRERQLFGFNRGPGKDAIDGNEQAAPALPSAEPATDREMLTQGQSVK
jgi:hypothetical protein